jgi:hypothetical protein
MNLEQAKRSPESTTIIIDCDAPPFIPEGLSLKEHQKGGQIEWNPSKVILYLSEKQKNGGIISGYDLQEDLKGKPVLNANVLDFLLKNPHLIPEEWKRECIFFWGTLYLGSLGSLHVRYLFWCGGGWYWGDCWVDDDFDGRVPAAVLASSPIHKEYNDFASEVRYTKCDVCNRVGNFEPLCEHDEDENLVKARKVFDTFHRGSEFGSGSWMVGPDTVWQFIRGLNK